MRVVPVGLVFAAMVLGAPSQSDRYRMAPLVSAAKLWNMVRYLDPRVTGDSTAWDSALAAALPKIEAAHTDEALATALDDMLKTLDDPCTRISRGMPGVGVSVQAYDAGTMVIHAGNGDMTSTMGAGLMLQMGIGQTQNVVWDLRGSRAPSSRVDIHQLSASGLGYAFRQHSGYPPQDGTDEHYYSSSLQIVEAQPAGSNRPAPSRRQVYLIDKDSAVPAQAIMDQINGRSAILSQDPPGVMQAGFTEVFRVLGKIEAEVRVAELYYFDGTTNFAPTRVMLNTGQEAVKAAVAAVESGETGTPGARPKFELRPSGFHDAPYADEPYPSREMRLLAAFRIWGVMHYFNPIVSAMGSKWDDALVELLPKFSEAKDAKEYHLAIAEMAARTGDASCRARSKELSASFGTAAPPFEARFVDNQLAITHVFEPGTVQAGEVIVKIAGEPVRERMAEISRYFAGPAAWALRSQLGQFAVTVRGKDDAEREAPVTASDAVNRKHPAHRLGDAVRLIDASVGYADLERVEASDVDAMFEKLAKTAAIIFDLRGDPRDTAGEIGARLGNRIRPVVAELQRNVAGIGTDDSHIGILQTELRLPLASGKRYRGKTVALIDGEWPGIAGENAMVFKAANGTVLVGSTAYPTFSGHLTVFDVPGGARVYFSGQVARWPDGRALRGGGVEADVAVAPTLVGIRAGRDEVLDKAVEYLTSK